MTQPLATFNKILFTKCVFWVQNAQKSFLFLAEARLRTPLGMYDAPPNFVVDWGGEYPFLVSLSRQRIRCLDTQSGFYDYE